MNFKLEVCAGSLTSALNAGEAGAHRVELCDNLSEGGTTPSPGVIMQAVTKLQIPVFVLIRPRSGDFIYSDAEFEAMKEDIVFCREQGAKGIVSGVLKTDGSVDKDRMEELVDLARPMKITFHRAIDMVRDPFLALEDIIALGIDRILTSGQANSAIEGTGLISELVKMAGDRIIIMPGSGINEMNIISLYQKTKTFEFHASLRSPVKSKMQFRNEKPTMGSSHESEFQWMETDPERVKHVIALLSDL